MHVALRKKIKEKYKIKNVGDATCEMPIMFHWGEKVDAKDVWTTWCCSPCAICQETKQLN